MEGKLMSLGCERRPVNRGFRKIGDERRTGKMAVAESGADRHIFIQKTIGPRATQTKQDAWFPRVGGPLKMPLAPGRG